MDEFGDPPLDLPDRLDPAVCAVEAERRIRWEQAAFARYRRLPADQQAEFHPVYNDICDARQAAVAVAGLGLLLARIEAGEAT